MKIASPSVVSALVLVALGWAAGPRGAAAQETIVITEDAAAGGAGGTACGCKGRQSPPWHGSVAAAECGPPCRVHAGTFHADPRGQLCVRRQLAEQCATLPPLFPRLHGCCTEGRMPTPRPLTVPHCRHCGALIEGGF